MNAHRILPCLFLLGSMAAWPADVSLVLTDDSTVTGNNPNANYGASTSLTIHDFGPKQGLVRFDADSIIGETVESATLGLFLNAIRGSGDVTVHVITSSWDEGSVTWDSLPSFEATAVTSAMISSSKVGSVLTIDVTGTVRQWADGTLDDFGFLVMTGDVVRAVFDSKEASGGTPPMLEVVVEDVATPGVGTPPIVLDLSSPPVVIDEPGHYILDRDWDIASDVTRDGPVIDMQANATLDLRGFAINDHATMETVIVIGSAGGTVMNGNIVGGFDGGGIGSEGRAVIHNLRIGVSGFNSFGLAVHDGSQVSNSSIGSGVGVSLYGDGISMVNSSVSGTDQCLFAQGNRISITGSTFSIDNAVFEMEIIGDQNSFSNNTIWAGQGGTGLKITGSENSIFQNTFKGNESVGLVIDGSGNIIKDNLMLPNEQPLQFVFQQIGIFFLQDGNFYRNNQVRAVVPFELGGTIQTDLGGNVGY